MSPWLKRILHNFLENIIITAFKFCYEFQSKNIEILLNICVYFWYICNYNFLCNTMIENVSSVSIFFVLEIYLYYLLMFDYSVFSLVLFFFVLREENLKTKSFLSFYVWKPPQVVIPPGLAVGWCVVIESTKTTRCAWDERDPGTAVPGSLSHDVPLNNLYSYCYKRLELS